MDGDSARVRIRTTRTHRSSILQHGIPKLPCKFRHANLEPSLPVICAILSTLVFVTNLIITIVCSVYGGQRNQTLYVGDCEKTQQINTGLHVLINLLSTTLLSASNYCMQCLSAPTRDDIDVAHARGKWLDST